MTKDELLDVARAHGVDVPLDATKARITAALAAAGIEPEPAEPAAPVRVQARWVDAQAVFVPGQGIVRYGDTVTVTVEQLACDHRLIAADAPFTPDPAVEAAARKEG